MRNMFGEEVQGYKIFSRFEQKPFIKCNTKIVLPMNSNMSLDNTSEAVLHDLELCVRLCVFVCSLRPTQKKKDEEKKRKSYSLFAVMDRVGGAFRQSISNLFFLMLCVCFSGGDEPREAQLGAPQRRSPCPDHGGGHTQPGQD